MTDRLTAADDHIAAIIEHRRVIKDVRRYARQHRAELDAEWDALTDPRMTLEEHIAAGKADVERWAQLQAEWNNPEGE